MHAHVDKWTVNFYISHHNYRLGMNVTGGCHCEDEYAARSLSVHQVESVPVHSQVRAA